MPLLEQQALAADRELVVDEQLETDTFPFHEEITLPPEDGQLLLLLLLYFTWVNTSQALTLTIYTHNNY